MKRLLTLLVAVIILIVLGYGALKMGVGQPLVPPKNDEAKEGYTAVFLDNDQVYFGKLSTSGQVIVLKDIYYIRLNQPQPQKEGEDQAQPQLSLVKLGDQIHGPVDEMRVNADHVLFVERLKDDSTVVKAIKTEKENKAKGGDQNAQTPAPAAAPAATPAPEQTAQPEATPAPTTEPKKQ